MTDGRIQLIGGFRPKQFVITCGNILPRSVTVAGLDIGEKTAY